MSDELKPCCGEKPAVKGGMAFCFACGKEFPVEEWNRRQEAKPLTVEQVAEIIVRKTRHSQTYCWSVAQAIHAAMPPMPSREAIEEILRDNLEIDFIRGKSHFIDEASIDGIKEAADRIMALWGNV